MKPIKFFISPKIITFIYFIISFLIFFTLLFFVIIDLKRFIIIASLSNFILLLIMMYLSIKTINATENKKVDIFSKIILAIYFIMFFLMFPTCYFLGNINLKKLTIINEINSIDFKILTIINIVFYLTLFFFALYLSIKLINKIKQENDKI